MIDTEEQTIVDAPEEEEVVEEEAEEADGDGDVVEEGDNLSDLLVIRDGDEEDAE